MAYPHKNTLSTHSLSWHHLSSQNPPEAFLPLEEKSLSMTKILEYRIYMYSRLTPKLLA